MTLKIPAKVGLLKTFAKSIMAYLKNQRSFISNLNEFRSRPSHFLPIIVVHSNSSFLLLALKSFETYLCVAPARVAHLHRHIIDSSSKKGTNDATTFAQLSLVISSSKQGHFCPAVARHIVEQKRHT